MLTRKLFITCLFAFFISCTVASQENPADMFVLLYEKYSEAEYESSSIESRLDDGISMIIFDPNKKISEDEFCEIGLFSSSGQTQYLIYRKSGENIWYINKNAFFYELPYQIDGAEIINTYFKYTNDLPYVFNDATGDYDIQADTNKYQAVVDVRSLAGLLRMVQNAIDRR